MTDNYEVVGGNGIWNVRHRITKQIQHVGVFLTEESAQKACRLFNERIMTDDTEYLEDESQ